MNRDAAAAAARTVFFTGCSVSDTARGIARHGATEGLPVPAESQGEPLSCRQHPAGQLARGEVGVGRQFALEEHRHHRWTHRARVCSSKTSRASAASVSFARTSGPHCTRGASADSPSSCSTGRGGPGCRWLVYTNQQCSQHATDREAQPVQSVLGRPLQPVPDRRIQTRPGRDRAGRRSHQRAQRVPASTTVTRTGSLHRITRRKDGTRQDKRRQDRLTNN